MVLRITSLLDLSVKSIAERIRRNRLFALLHRPCNCSSSSSSTITFSHRFWRRTSFTARNMSSSTSSLSAEARTTPHNDAGQIELFTAVEDSYDGVTLDMKEHVDSQVFIPLLRASLSKWRQQGKKGVWIKLPIGLAHLVKPVVQEGFWYHHAETDYLMLVRWLPDTPVTLPVNASHRVGIGAFVMNNKGQVLVVKEKNGGFKGKGVWKLPTGVVNEGEDICIAAIREVKEETGIDADFVEILAFRQSHQSFFMKSDLFFVCMLQPRHFDIKKQDSEIEDAQWMAISDYVNQPYNKGHQLFKYIAEICKIKSEKEYSGFSAVPTSTASGKLTYLYYNDRDLTAVRKHHPNGHVSALTKPEGMQDFAHTQLKWLKEVVKFCKKSNSQLS